MAVGWYLRLWRDQTAQRFLTDFAILRLIRDLELRGAETVELCLEDIDWRGGYLAW